MTARKQALALLGESLQEWQTGEGEPLHIDRAIRHRVWITMGGPTAYIDIFTSETGDPLYGDLGSTYSGDRVSGELSEEEVEALAELFALGVNQ